MTALIDVLTRRQAELCCLLSGGASIDPRGVLPLIRALDTADFIDEQARAYIRVLSRLLPEIEAATEEKRAYLVYQAAIDCDCTLDWLRWLCLPELPAIETAKKTIREIKALVVTRKTVEQLASYAASLEEFSRWGVNGR